MNGSLTQRHRELKSQFKDKWDYLHSDYSKKSKRNKRDLATDEVEYGRGKDQFTFHPDTRKPSSVSPTRRINVKDNQIKRIPSPRKKFSIPGGSGVRNSLSKNNEQFMINVNIGGDKKTIIASLNSDPSHTAEQFMSENQIDKKFHKTLTDLIAD